MNMEKEVRSEKVLFVVYRKEWWGCFDSLCRRECAKRNTLVYVVPTVRFDRDRNTMNVNFEKKHFSGDGLAELLPEGACMADIQDIPLAQGFDRIYVHNPYDNSYPVDTVERTFYASNLKQYTKKLIYVPHVLFLGGIWEEFTECPVYEHADVIYISDQRARYCLPVEYDKKVEMVPAGIVEYMDRLPERAERKKEEPKTLLFCVSYLNLYYGTEKAIGKIQDVFEYFRDCGDIRLIFRPDEDIQARYLWLQASIRQKYEELLAYFKRNRIGIYDESPDLYRAAAEADGILTMGHYMDALFYMQGKYVLHLDMTRRPIPSREVRCIPSFWHIPIAEEEDRIDMWFVPDGTRLICKMTIEGGPAVESGVNYGKRTASRKRKESVSVEIAAEAPDDIFGDINYLSLIKEGNFLYLPPYMSEGVWKYDMVKGEFTEQYLEVPVDCATSFAVSYGEYLYFIPRNYPGIIKYHKLTEAIQVIDGWVEELEQYVSTECRKEPYFLLAIVQEENMLYLASSKSDVWMEYDMDRDTWRMKSMNLPGKKFLNMVKRGEWVWLLPYLGEDLILWNCATEESQVIYTASVKESKHIPYEYILDLGEAIGVFPAAQENLLLISLTDGEDVSKEITLADGKKSGIQVLEVTGRAPCREKDYLSEYLKQFYIGYRFVKRLKNGNILTYEYYDGSFLILNTKLQVLEKIPCRLPMEAVRRQINNAWAAQQCKMEFNGWLDERYSLPAMLDFFLDQGEENRKEIREHYEKKICIYSK